MKIEAPEFLRKLCAIESIRPFSHYVQRSPWKLRKANFDEEFQGKMGIYCCWWSGPRQEFVDRIARREDFGERLPGRAGITLEHDHIPAYVGRTANAASRIRQRLTQFPSSMKRWLTKEKRLVEFPEGNMRHNRLNGFCGNFELFDYRERVRYRIASIAGDPKLSQSEAQSYLIEHELQIQPLIDEFQQSYYSLMYDNYSISFVPFLGGKATLLL